MAIGERIRQARRVARLNLRELAERVGVSAQAISKYERGLDTPSSGVLLRLAQALGVRVEFFVRPYRRLDFEPVYRKRTGLPVKEEQAMLGQVRDWLERYLETEALLTCEEPRFSYLQGFPYVVRSPADVERAAEALRDVWRLGLDPLENLTELLEDKAIKVGIVAAHGHFDACAFRVGADGEIPVIVVKQGLPGDRQRLNLAHELGHLLLEPGGDIDPEKMAHRFAGAFLVPQSAARFELGQRRHALDLYELHLLKHKYGLSMQAWIYRAKDVGIISETAAGRLFQTFRQRGWHEKEPGETFPAERPWRFARLVLHALAEQAVSEARAAELVGKPLAKFFQDVAEEHGGLPPAMHNGQQYLD